MEISKLPEYDNHELISYFNDKKTGLRGFIAIHNTNLGPTAGGTRYFQYKSEEEALRDVLRLSKAMTYKCALAGVPHGGAKAVIIKDPKFPKNEKFLAAYAKRINLLNGNFSTGEDVGISQEDVNILSKYSKFMIGHKNLAGDPSPWAGLGVFWAMHAALQSVFGNDKFSDKSFAIKGLGKVGFSLLELIYKNGGRNIFVTDINKETANIAKKKFPEIKIVSPNIIHKQKVDVYAPCAMGAEFTETTIKELKCRIICGGANNQLANKKIGEDLHKKKILYIPDYLANGGGLINVVSELRPEGFSRNWVEQKTKAICQTAQKIIDLSKKQNKSTSEVADRLAESIFGAKSI
ncbi:MAG: Glu/Leu/Phe/Val dehydrogenase dimerization domain-containing protein [Candidatus Paceibacterota bacterium]|jgi:leucine dehydrogenase